MLRADSTASASVMEPAKCEKWEWLTWDQVPKMQPMFPSLQHLIQHYAPPKASTST